MHGGEHERVPLVDRGGAKGKNKASVTHRSTDLQHEDAMPAKPDAGKLIIASIALLVASTSSILVLRQTWPELIGSSNPFQSLKISTNSPNAQARLSLDMS
ncbi:hypothetical protein TorRG33x02_115800 [Trema orientale]|uniref:Uncharacterized protein n=1 Tax=Trema orientale TaxID=63057 RepID=A0A2P5F4J1_TREOI|nr:hypothetical protein TorRG33x02_115800 [Trema orientale]